MDTGTDIVAPEVREIEALAEDAAVPMSRVLARAGVALTTYWRWRHGSEPKVHTIRKLKEVISELKGAA
jgi:hypothetical protein